MKLPIPAWADRNGDRPVRRPPNLVHAPEDTPGPAQGLGLALQQIALQSVYWLLPPLVGAAYGMEPAALTSLIALGLLGSALAAVLQGLPRGPVGSGYGMPNVPTPIFFGAYMLAASSGISLGAASASMILAAIVALVLFLAFPRILNLIPPELAGLVVFMIGVSLLPRVIDLLTRDVARGMPEQEDLAVFAVTLAVMVAVATIRWPLARFALIVGGAIGSAADAVIHPTDPAALAAVAAAPWIGVPALVTPEFGGVTVGIFLAFFIAMVCLLPDWLGDMTLYQRASDAGWTKPDPAPLRRGIVAGILGVVGAGAMGAFGPSTSSACVGLGIATRSLSRAVAMFGSALLVLLALSPKLISLFVLIPASAAAAMVAYVSAFMATSGATLISSRVLDVRRTCAVGLGLVGGLGVLVAPDFLARHLPGALASPVTLSFAIGFALHLATLPGVMRRMSETVVLGPGAVEAVDRFVENAAGTLGLRRVTADAVRHALLETVEVLSNRGGLTVELRLAIADDLVRAAVAHPGPALPAPAARPDVADLEGALVAQEAFAMWLASREALACVPRGGRGAASVEFEFRD
jgi:NCS2 family nucleobase:cation symporter-2